MSAGLQKLRFSSHSMCLTLLQSLTMCLIGSPQHSIPTAIDLEILLRDCWRLPVALNVCLLFKALYPVLALGMAIWMNSTLTEHYKCIVLDMKTAHSVLLRYWKRLLVPPNGRFLCVLLMHQVNATAPVKSRIAI